MIEIKKIAIYARAIKDRGPIRVLLSKNEIVPINKSKNYSIVYIRKDGWSLGAPEELADFAYEMYKDEWAAVLKKPFDKFELLQERK